MCNSEAKNRKFGPIFSRIQSYLIFCRLHFFWLFHGTLLSFSCLILNCVKFLKLYLGQREAQFNKTETTAIPCSKFLRRSKYKMATIPTLSHSPQEVFPWSLLLSREKSLVCAKNSSTCCWPLYSFPSSSYSPHLYILNTQALLKLIGH